MPMIDKPGVQPLRPLLEDAAVTDRKLRLVAGAAVDDLLVAGPC